MVSVCGTKPSAIDSARTVAESSPPLSSTTAGRWSESTRYSSAAREAIAARSDPDLPGAGPRRYDVIFHGVGEGVRCLRPGSPDASLTCLSLRDQNESEDRRMAHKKGQGSSRNGRDSNPQMLGIK